MKPNLEPLERVFRRLVAYPVLRLLLQNEQVEAPIKASSVRRVLVFRYDRIGDMILTLPMLKALKSKLPEAKVTVLASNANAELAEGCPFVDETVILPTSLLSLLRQILALRRQNFDVVINLVFNRTTGPGILANLIAPRGTKIGQGPDRYRFYFNRLLKLHRFQQHMVESLRDYLGATFDFDVSEMDLKPDISIDIETRNRVDAWLQAHGLRRRDEGNGEPYILFNVSAHDAARKLSPGQVRFLGAHLNEKKAVRTVFLIAPDDPEMAETVETGTWHERCFVFRTSTNKPLTELASIIGGAVMVITPDTSVVHFACATGTPIMGIYTDLQGMKEWLPFGVPGKIVMAETGKPASTVRPETIVRAAEEFFSSVTSSMASPQRSSR